MMKRKTGNQEIKSWVRDIVVGFISDPRNNNLTGMDGERAWDEPLVGFAAGSDPLFAFFKEDIGEFYWTPEEAFHLAHPSRSVSGEQLTVIAWILPQTEATRSDNRKQSFYPSERWARARIFGEEVNVRLRSHVVESLKEAGYPAVAPMLLPQWERRDSIRYGYASKWSERHAAYACGLGTFGLCDGLITPKGKAVRVGSVVAMMTVSPDPRPYEDHHSYCLFFTKGTCGKCMDRCPVGVVTENGHDKFRCGEHIRPVTQNYVKAKYGFDGYGCGLCQTAVPCESRIPQEP